MLYKYLFACLFLVTNLLSGNDIKIVVIIPSYNNAQWYVKNLTSLLSQNYANWTAIYIDDASPDHTGQLVAQFLAQYDIYNRVKLICNEARQGALANIWRAVHMIEDDDVVVVLLDGDDWFYDEHVLQRVNQEYYNPETWMTFGQYVIYPTGQLGHCRAPSPEIIENNDWRSSILLPYSHLRTFYAWLFKQVKLDDLLIKNIFFPVAGDNAYIFPMLEMAGRHAHFIPDVLYVYNQDNQLNDYKNNLDLQLRIAHYIKQKKHYEMLQDKPVMVDAKKAVIDLITFSFDRPLQLYAFLESVEYYITGLSCIHVLYRASNDAMEIAYQEVKERFKMVQFTRQSTIDPHADFKPVLLQMAFNSTDGYVIFGVDDIVVKDYVDLTECVALLEATHAYGFFLRLGKNIKRDYILDLSINKDPTVPEYIEIVPEILACQFRYAKHLWAYPNTLDMTLYRKKDIEHAFRTLEYSTPNRLEGDWYGSTDFSGIGLSYAESKIVNIPLNIVQEKGHNKIFNPHKVDYSIYELLNIFNAGLKMDFKPLHDLRHDAGHVDYEPTFVRR